MISDQHCMPLLVKNHGDAYTDEDKRVDRDAVIVVLYIHAHHSNNTTNSSTPDNEIQKKDPRDRRTFNN